jgi:hypothetical protein
VGRVRLVGPNGLRCGTWKRERSWLPLYAMRPPSVASSPELGGSLSATRGAESTSFSSSSKWTAIHPRIIKGTSWLAKR